jgi:L-iditol 2-dehydrogenase
MMKAAVYYAPGEIRYEDVPVPGISDDEILVKVRACGFCGTDLTKILSGNVKTPAVLGHEVAGDVVESGTNVSKFSTGERVVVAHHVCCFVCDFCRHGRHSLCEEFKENNMDPGGFAQYLRIKPRSVQRATFTIPDNLSYEEASMMEPAACCLRGLMKCDIQPGDTVMVIGAGAIGLILLQIARILGAGTLIVSDILDARLEKSKKFGADITVNPSKENVAGKVKSIVNGNGVNIVVLAVPKIEALTDAMECARPGGTVCDFAECPGKPSLTIDPNWVYHEEVRLIGSYSSTPSEQAVALSMIQTKQLKVKELITGRFSLNQLGQAVQTAVSGKDSLKLMIIP